MEIGIIGIGMFGIVGLIWSVLVAGMYINPRGTEYGSSRPITERKELFSGRGIPPEEAGDLEEMVGKRALIDILADPPGGPDLARGIVRSIDLDNEIICLADATLSNKERCSKAYERETAIRFGDITRVRYEIERDNNKG